MLDRLLEQIRSETFDLAHNPDAGELRLTSLLRAIMDRLEEAGIYDDCHLAYYREDLSNLAAEVHGFCLDGDDDVLALFFCIDANEAVNLDDVWTAAAVAKDQIDRAFRRLEGFVRLVQSNKTGNIDDSQSAAELVELVQECIAEKRTIVYNVITTGTVSERAAVSRGREGTSREVWDLLRLQRTCGDTGDDRLFIDFAEEYQQALPCLVTPRTKDGLQVLLTHIPGRLLADIYNTYRSRLLERNVRSFLQFTGKVNKGIRETLLVAPEHFLPYNNGISATASEVDLEDLGQGLARIRAVHDFQVVNGGQTSASIAACARRDGAGLDMVTVPMKLTIVPPSMIDQMVPLISRYANTQNRIQEADFTANHPWHIQFEKLSRDTWTRPGETSPRGTRWYFERSRGQYADDLAAQNTPAGKRRFRAENPSSQKITKTDLAKFVLSWEQQPAIVSRGAQKCFVFFMNQLIGRQCALPTQDDFRRIAVLGILFHTAERLCNKLEFKGYRANIVTYSLARLSLELQRRLPWDRIWETQSIPKELEASLIKILLGVRDVIGNPPGGRNVTEWCKREECSSCVMDLAFDLGLPDLSEWQPYSVLDDHSQGAGVTDANVASINQIPADVWFAISKWAKERGVLQSWQRSLSYSIGRLISQGRVPSTKQATQGLRLMRDALYLGFSHDELNASCLEQ